MLKEKRVLIGKVDIPEGATKIRIDKRTGEIFANFEIDPIFPRKLIGYNDPIHYQGLAWRTTSVCGNRTNTSIQVGYLKGAEYINIWYPRTERQKEAKEKIIWALSKVKDYEDTRWIPTYEISLSKKSREIKSVSCKMPLQKRTCYEGIKIAKAYDPQNGSRPMRLSTRWLYLYQLLVDGEATPEELFDDSSELGNYYNSKDSPKELLQTGKNVLGGVSHGIGNLATGLVDDDNENVFYQTCDSFNSNGEKCPAGRIMRNYYPDTSSSNTMMGIES